MTQTQRHVAAALLIAGIGIASYTLYAIAPAHAQGAGGTITGYAWSDTIGWISLAGSTYGLTVASDGTISGYAWSDHIGWISANTSDLSGCPSSPCNAKIAGSQMSGWLKALAGGTAQSGGWDGWISLSGSNYGLTKNPDGTFSNFAWGSDIVGWIHFSGYPGVGWTDPLTYPRTDYSICATSSSYTCIGSGENTIRRTDTDAYCGNTITDGPTCASPQFCSVGSPVCHYPPIAFSGGSGFTAGDDFTGHLIALPLLVRNGTIAKLYWNVENVSGCSVEGTNGQVWNNISSGQDGQTTNLINQSTTFTLFCVGEAGSSITESQTIHIVPEFLEL